MIARAQVWLIRAWLWLETDEFCQSGPDDMSLIHRIAQREVNAVNESIRSSIEWHTSEVDILTARLTRRYDVGMAMNEATQRAMDARKAAWTDHDIIPMTGRQNAALAFQEMMLKRNQERSAR